jgi:hypothetical protein
VDSKGSETSVIPELKDAGGRGGAVAHIVAVQVQGQRVRAESTTLPTYVMGSKEEGVLCVCAVPPPWPLSVLGGTATKLPRPLLTGPGLGLCERPLTTLYLVHVVHLMVDKSSRSLQGGRARHSGILVDMLACLIYLSASVYAYIHYYYPGTCTGSYPKVIDCE